MRVDRKQAFLQNEFLISGGGFPSLKHLFSFAGRLASAEAWL